MEVYLGIVSQGVFAVVVTACIVTLGIMALMAVALGVIKGGRFFILQMRQALREPEHKVLSRGKTVAKVFRIPDEKVAQKMKKVKNGKGEKM